MALRVQPKLAPMDTNLQDNSQHENTLVPTEHNSQHKPDPPKKLPLDDRVCRWLEQGARIAIALTVFLVLLKHLASFLLGLH